MKIHILFWIVILQVVLACSNTQKYSIDENLQKQYPIRFEESETINDQFEMLSGLRANKQGDTIIYYGWISNQSKKEIILTPYLIELQSQNYSRCTPIHQNQNISISPGTDKFFKYKFLPINNKRIYRHSGFRGDLNQVYSIKVNFLLDHKRQAISRDQIEFTINSVDWDVYTKQFASDHLFTIYEMNNPDERQKEIQSKHLRKINALSTENKPNINHRVSETEILINDIVLTNKLFHFKDSLYLNFRIINYGKFPLHLNPDSIRITNSNIKGTTEISEEEFTLVTLKKGDRFQRVINLGYLLNVPEKLELDLSAIKYFNKEKVFTYHPEFYKALD